MESLTSLRSLDVSGGPTGTGRPTSSIPGTPTADFAADLASARRVERHEARRESSREASRERDESRREERVEAHREAERPREQTPESHLPEPGSVDEVDPTEGLPRQGQPAAEPDPGRESGQDRAEGPAEAPERGAGAASEVAPEAAAAPAAFLALPPPALPPLQAPGQAGAPTSSATPAAATPAGQATGPVPANPASGSGETDAGPGEGEGRPTQAREAADAQRPAEATRPSAEPAPTAVEARTGGVQRASEAPRAQAPSAPPPPAGSQEAIDHAAAILDQVRLRLLPGAREATLQLEPARLGRLSIRLELRRGVTRAELVVEEAATLEVLQRHEPELRAALADAGFQGVEVELRHAGDGERGRGDARGHAAHHGPSRTSGERAPRALTRALARRLTTTDGIDTYA